MKVHRSWFVTVVIFSLCLMLIYYTIISKNSSVRIRGNRAHIEPQYGRYCVEENICKNTNTGRVYTYVRSIQFYTLIDHDINPHRNIVHAYRIVPNIVHYTWYGHTKNGNIFSFVHMLAVLSAHKFIKPDKIYVWHESVPTGPYWEEVNARVPELCLVFRKSPTIFRNISAALPEYSSGVVSLEALIEYGGMYFNLDVVVLKPLDTLLHYDMVMGYEPDSCQCSGAIFATPWSDFLKLWHKEYKTLDHFEWGKHSMVVPAQLVKRYPGLLHKAASSLSGPNWKQADLLYKEGVHYDWRKNNYASHLWTRLHKPVHDAVDIKIWNTTAGEMFRWIYYGDWRINKKPASSTVCLLKYICKESTKSKSYKYTRREDFWKFVDSPVDLNRNVDNPETRVPKIVHFTWYGERKTFTFQHLISVLAAHKFIKPEMVLLWHDLAPVGKYWEEVLHKVPELTLVYRKTPTEIRRKTLHTHEQATDIVRLEAVMEFGGIYFDLDAVVVKSMEPLLKYDVTMGYVTDDGLCNGVLIGKAWAPFLKLWHKQYAIFNDSNTTRQLAKLPTILARRHPNLIHTEAKSLHRPNFHELKQLYKIGYLYNWRQANYVVRLWMRLHKTEHNAEDIIHWNTTVGEIFRYVYYGEDASVQNTHKICIYNNLCKNRETDTAFKYTRLPNFMSRIDAAVNFKLEIKNEKRIIPNITHFTWYGGLKKGNTFRFHHMIAVLAAHRFLKPERILFWHDMVPEGPYWAEVTTKVPELTLVYRDAPNEIRGRKVRVAEHLTDIVRLEAVLEFGGMYFDLDAIVLKPLDPLLKYDVVMGYENSIGLCNGIIISKPWAEFLRVWHKEYSYFDDNNWAYHSVQLPAKLAKRYPHLVHTEKRSMHRPNWQETSWLYDVGKLYDWRSNNYAVHLWIRFHHTEHNAVDIKTWNTTTGEIFRHVYYGDWRIKT